MVEIEPAPADIVVYMTPEESWSILSAWSEEEIKVYHVNENCPKASHPDSPNVLTPLSAHDERVSVSDPCDFCVRRSEHPEYYRSLSE